jgi:hypothetical protein
LGLGLTGVVVEDPSLFATVAVVPGFAGMT